jgi:hypothetical protein
MNVTCPLSGQVPSASGPWPYPRSLSLTLRPAPMPSSICATRRGRGSATLQMALAQAQAVGSLRLFSIRHEFPTAWAKFKNIQLSGATTRAELALTLRAEHYPFWSQGLPIMLHQITCFAHTTSSVTLSDSTGTPLMPDTTLNLRVASLHNIQPLPAAPGTWTTMRQKLCRHVPGGCTVARPSLKPAMTRIGPVAPLKGWSACWMMGSSHSFPVQKVST